MTGPLEIICSRCLHACLYVHAAIEEAHTLHQQAPVHAAVSVPIAGSEQASLASAEVASWLFEAGPCSAV